MSLSAASSSRVVCELPQSPERLSSQLPGKNTDCGVLQCSAPFGIAESRAARTRILEWLPLAQN
jgi:hypothetical protein